MKFREYYLKEMGFTVDVKEFIDSAKMLFPDNEIKSWLKRTKKNPKLDALIKKYNVEKMDIKRQFTNT